MSSANRTHAAFDENLVSFAGLVPVMRLAQQAGLPDRIRLRDTVRTPPSVLPHSRFKIHYRVRVIGFSQPGMTSAPRFSELNARVAEQPVGQLRG